MPTLAEVLTDSFLRRQAGTRAYHRGVDYFTDGCVVHLECDEDSFTAIVRGQRNYEVCIALQRPGVSHDCDCPMGHEGDFCKHCVAACLAWRKLPPGEARPKAPEITLADAMDRLQAEPHDALVQMLMSWAEEDHRLRHRILQFAARRAGPEAAAAVARANFRRAAKSLRAFDYEDVLGRIQELNEALNTFQDLLKDGHAATAVSLTEDALQSVSGVMAAAGDDEEEAQLTNLNHRLQQLHYEACVQARPEPVELAARLYELELEFECDLSQSSPERYKDILGPVGLATFRKLLEQPRHAHDYRVRALRQSVAVAMDDVDTLVSIFSRELNNPNSYRKIIEIYETAGRHDEALEWAEKALYKYPTDLSLRELAANQYHRRNEHSKAMELMWSAYQESLSLWAYDKLREHAEQAGDWADWRDNAIGLIRRVIAAQKKRGPADHSQLVAIYLHEGKLDDAWREAQIGGCTPRQWLRMAEEREQHSPSDSIPIYLRQVETEIKTVRNGNYQNAVNLLIRVAGLMKSLGGAAEFQKQLSAIRAQFKAKRNFIKLLDAHRAHFVP